MRGCSPMRCAPRRVHIATCSPMRPGSSNCASGGGCGMTWRAIAGDLQIAWERSSSASSPRSGRSRPGADEPWLWALLDSVRERRRRGGASPSQR